MNGGLDACALPGERRSVFFSLAASLYEPFLDLGTCGRFRRYHRLLAEELEACEGMRILDLGCGPGRIAGLVSGQIGEKGEYLGVDASPGMIRAARRKHEHFGNVRFENGRAQGFEADPGTFDRIVISLLLHEVRPEARDEILKKSFHLLKPEGKLIIGEYGNPTGIVKIGMSFFVRIVEDDSVFNFLTEDREKLLADYGFSDVREQSLFWGFLGITTGWKSKREPGS